MLAFTQQFDNFLINFINVLPCEQFHRGTINAVIIEGIESADAVFARHDKIVDTMVCGGVHSAGTRLGSDMITKQHRHLPIVERVLQ